MLVKRIVFRREIFNWRYAIGVFVSGIKRASDG